jgi:hypothetical protein
MVECVSAVVVRERVQATVVGSAVTVGAVVLH